MKWIWLGSLLGWAMICLAISLYIAKLVSTSKEDVYISLLFGIVLFLAPLWYLVKYFYQRRESREIKKYVESIRNKGSVDDNQTKQ